MTNLHEPDARSGNVERDASLDADLTMLYRLPVPDLRLNLSEPAPGSLPAATGAAPTGRRFLLRHWRPLVTFAGAAAVLAVFVAGPSLWGNDTTHVSAEEILQRTNAAAAGNVPVAGTQRYHLVATAEFTAMICSGRIDENGTSSGTASSDGANAKIEATGGDSVKCEASGKQTNNTEIWFADGEHFHNSQTFDGLPDGTPSTFGSAVNGDDAWLYLSDGNGLRVVHGSSDALGMTWGLGQPDSKSLADVLGQYSKDRCQSARQTGEATVLGRTAYVIEVSQTPESCGLGDGGTIVKRLPDGGDAGTMTVWVDRGTFLPLKTENRDGDGTLIYRYYVTEIQVGADIPASAFEYQPPAGTTVTEVTTAVGAKQALAGEKDGASNSSGSFGDPETGTSKVEPATPVAQ